MKEINTKLENCDYKAIMWARRILPGFARFAIFLVYFWFGILKVIGLSPASPLVAALLAKTMPFISPDAFVVAFGAIEVVIGLLFVIPKLERLAIFALILHLITTILPLFFLPHLAWTGFMVPTLEGQYIIKNVLLMTAGIAVLASLIPLQKTKANV